MTSRKPSLHLPSICLWLGAFALAALGIAGPASARGKWEMGSFVPGDYESGMNGYIVIE
jgi:hypothetical protein